MKLFSKFGITILAIVVVGVSVLGAYAFTSVHAILIDQAGKRQLETARQTIERIDQHLYERTLDLAALTKQAEIYTAATGSPASLSKASESLKQFQAINPAWAQLSIVNIAGVARASTDDAASGQTVGGGAGTLAELYRQALSGETVHSDAKLSGAGKLPVVTFMAPLRNGQAIVGVLAGEVAWSTVAGMVETVSAPGAYLLNSKGLVLASNQMGTTGQDFHATPVFEQAHQGDTGVVTAPGLGDTNQLAITAYVAEPGTTNYAGNGWYLVVSTPASVVVSAGRGPLAGLMTILVSFLSLGIGVIFWMLNRRVLRPINALSEAIKCVKLGDLSQTAPAASGDEVGQLGRDFNDMVMQLATTHRSLHQTTVAADEGRAQLESSINGLRQGFILTDAHGKTLLANAAARELVRSARSTSASHRSRMTVEDLAGLLPADTKLTEHITRTIHHRDSAKLTTLPLGGRFLNVYLSPVVNEKTVIGSVLLLEDVTEERILQRSRDEFFSIASHELRTPLTAIRGNTSLIRQYFPDTLKDPAMNEMINDIHESAVRLIEIVNDFLDASRLEQNKMKFELQPLSVEPLVEKIIYELASLSRDKGIVLNFDQNTLGKLPVVVGDPNRVKQVLYNLLGNAMKFTKQGSVTVNCLIHQHFVKVCVSDTGPGISTEGQQLLFHKFQQTGASIITRDDTRGTGLGLYISKLLVEHMGGEIKLEHSELGKGTTFSFTLPIDPNSPGPIK